MLPASPGLKEITRPCPWCC